MSKERKDRMEDTRLVLNVDTVAKMLNLSRNSVYAGIKRGEIPHISVGKRLLIPRAALEKMLTQDERISVSNEPGR